MQKYYFFSLETSFYGTKQFVNLSTILTKTIKICSINFKRKNKANCLIETNCKLFSKLQLV